MDLFVDRGQAGLLALVLDHQGRDGPVGLGVGVGQLVDQAVDVLVLPRSIDSAHDY